MNRWIIGAVIIYLLLVVLAYTSHGQLDFYVFTEGVLDALKGLGDIFTN